MPKDNTLELNQHLVEENYRIKKELDAALLQIEESNKGPAEGQVTLDDEQVSILESAQAIMAATGLTSEEIFESAAALELAGGASALDLLTDEFGNLATIQESMTGATPILQNLAEFIDEHGPLEEVSEGVKAAVGALESLVESFGGLENNEGVELNDFLESAVALANTAGSLESVSEALDTLAPVAEQMIEESNRLISEFRKTWGIDESFDLDGALEEAGSLEAIGEALTTEGLTPAESVDEVYTKDDKGGKGDKDDEDDDVEETGGKGKKKKKVDEDAADEDKGEGVNESYRKAPGSLMANLVTGANFIDSRQGAVRSVSEDFDPVKETRKLSRLERMVAGK